MKSLMLASLFLFTAGAQAAVFSASSSWNGDNAFNTVEVQGIRMGSIQKSLDKCLLSGSRYCAFKGSENELVNKSEYSTTHAKNRLSTKVSSVIQSIDDLGLVPGAMYEKQDTWNFSTTVTALQSEGVRAEALDNALSACQMAGNHFCVILNTSFVENNQLFYDTTYSKNRYKTTAKAIVQGFMISPKN